VTPLYLNGKTQGWPEAGPPVVVQEDGVGRRIEVQEEPAIASQSPHRFVTTAPV
jgi:hypothetical protein